MATCQVNNNLHDECPICLNQFKIPKALPCLHSFCQSCLQNYIDRNFNKKEGSFLCPVCRVKCQPRLFIENGSNIPVKQIVKHLPTNFYINTENGQQRQSSNIQHEPLDETCFSKLEQFEKQIHDYKKKIEQQHRRNMIWVHTLKEGLRFCVKDTQLPNSFHYKVEKSISNEFTRIQECHDSLDKSLMELEKIREETVSLIMPKDKNRKEKKRQKKKKTSGGSFDIKRNLNEFEGNLESTFEQLTISDSKNELKSMMDQMQRVWGNPEGEPTALFLKTANQDPDTHAFPMLNECLYICSVKVMYDETVVVCGRSPNILLCYDANIGLLKSRFELSYEPSNMYIYDNQWVMVTFPKTTEIHIIDVSCSPPSVIFIVETKFLYRQIVSLGLNENCDCVILGLSPNDDYDALETKNMLDRHLTLKSKGHIPDRYPGSQMGYINQRKILVYPDKNRKCLLAFSLISKKVEFKYDGDTENPLVVISDVCCSDSFIFIADKRHHKVHKLSFYGKSLEIIRCHDFGMLWPLYIHVNKFRTMAICSQKKDSSYVLKTFFF